jgi:hypothetical protein
MRAAVNALKEMNPLKIIVAVPTSSPETCADFENEVDEIICAITPETFSGVGQWTLIFPLYPMKRFVNCFFLQMKKCNRKTYLTRFLNETGLVNFLNYHSLVSHISGIISWV